MATVRHASCASAPHPAGGQPRTLNPLASRSAVRSRTTSAVQLPSLSLVKQVDNTAAGSLGLSARTGRSQQLPSAVRNRLRAPAASTPLTCPRARRCCRVLVTQVAGYKACGLLRATRTRISGLRRLTVNSASRPGLATGGGCSAMVNTARPGQVVWSKVDDRQPAGGDRASRWRHGAQRRQKGSRPRRRQGSTMPQRLGGPRPSCRVL